MTPQSKNSELLTAEGMDAMQPKPKEIYNILALGYPATLYIHFFPYI